jgi:hypothetical protein
LASNNLGGLVLPEGWTEDYYSDEGWTDTEVYKHTDGREQKDNPGKPAGIITLADAIADMAALCSLDLSRNNIGADGVAIITATLKTHAIENQRPCIGIRLGDQDQHFWARTKDLRALLVATSNLNPSHCMPAISAYLLKDIAEWL